MFNDISAAHQTNSGQLNWNVSVEDSEISQTLLTGTCQTSR